MSIIVRRTRHLGSVTRSLHVTKLRAESSHASTSAAGEAPAKDPAAAARNSEPVVEVNADGGGSDGPTARADEETASSTSGDARKRAPKPPSMADRLSDIGTGLMLAGVAGAGVWAYFNQETVTEKIRFFTEPSREKLLPEPVHYPGGQTPRTLVLELDDTLVHSMWSRQTGWRTTKRPGVEAFLAYLSSFYEIVLFTSQLPTYADPVLDKLDPNGYIMHRLYRDATKYKDGVHIKDISKLNRDPARTIVIDANPDAFQMQPANGISVPKWDRDPRDRQLLDLIPFLEYIVREDVGDVRPLLASYSGHDIGTEFAKRKSEEALAAQSRYSNLSFGSSLRARSSPPPPPPPPPEAVAPPAGADASSEQGSSLLGRLRHKTQ